MSIKRTVIKADEELVIKGKLTIEGNVTQIETTQQVTNLQGNVFTINSDGSDTSAILALNSNGTTATLTFDDTNGSIVINKPTIFSSGNVTASIFVGDVIGTVSNIANHTTTALSEGTNLYFTTGRANSAMDAYLVGGTGLTYSSGTFAVGAGTGITVNADDVAVNATFIKGLFSSTDAGGDGSFSYSDGVFTYTGPSASEVRAHISAGTGITVSSGVIATTITQYTDALARAVVSVTDSGGDGSLAYDNSTGVITYTGPSASEVRAHISVTDAGGDGSLAYDNSTGVITYTGPSASEVRAHITDGDGIDYANGSISVDSTVIRTSGGQIINGNLELTGDLIVRNIDSLTQTDSFVRDKVLFLNVGGGTSPNNSKISVEKTAANVYLEYDSVWKFTNDGINILPIATSTTDLNEGNNLYFTTGRVNTAIDAYVIGGNGLTYSSGTIAVGAGTGITVNADDVAINADFVKNLISASDGVSYNSSTGALSVDSTVVRTTGDQSLANTKTFTGELIIPGTDSESNAAIFARGSQVFAYLNGLERELTPQVDIGVVTTADAGNTGIDIYAGLQLVGNVTTHFIRSIDAGTLLSISEAANVITIAGNSTAIRGLISGSGNISYNSTTGVISESLTTTDIDEGTNLYFTAARARGNISGTGLISYNSSTGVITTTADNYGSWAVQTGSGAGAKHSVTSNSTVNVAGGTGITVTNTGGNITISSSSSADIDSVTAGSGLTGGGTSGAVTLNVGAGAGITVNAADVAVNSSFIRGLVSATDAGGDGSFNYDSASGAFTYTGPSQAEANIRIDARISGGTGITYNSGVIATTNTQYTDALARAAVSVTDAGGDGSLSYDSGTGVITYTGPSQSEANTRIDARLSGGTGITYTSGVIAATNNGTVTSVAGIGTVNGLTLTGTVTASGSLTLGGTLAIAATQVTSGTLAVARGGTGVTTSTGTGAVVLSTSPTLVTPVLGTPSSGTLTNTTGLPIVEGTTGTLSVARGGTGQTSLTSGNYLKGAGTGAIGTQSGVPGEDITSGTISNNRTTATSTLTPNTIVLRDVSGNFAANVITATATSARYADLAENYLADAEYEPGTVLVFGGEAEVSQSTVFESTKVAGVVTTQPAHVMNSHLAGEHVVCVALRGRVPMKVKGVVRKGDVLVSAGEGLVGYAVAALYPRDVPAAAIVGKAITDKLDTGLGIVEALI